MIPRPSVDDSDHVTSLVTPYQERLRYVTISVADQPPDVHLDTQAYMDNQKPKLRDAVSRILDPTRADSLTRLAGFVVDMFCTSMIEVADEFKLPTYMMYTSNAAFLGITLHLQLMFDEKKYDVSELDDSVNELEFPCLTRPYLLNFFDSVNRISNPHGHGFQEVERYFTVAELEPQSLNIFSGDLSQVYPVGPLLHLHNDDVEGKESEILQWLDEQPERSVVFLCFGSMGGFNDKQTREIAVVLERSGHRFLWSLHRGSPNIMTEPPGDYKNLEEVLPEGFFDRTSERGKVIGWAPKVAVLTKPAIGSFVTHCGSNSMLESLWFGVLMVTWPLYAEQKISVFEMVDELGMVVEIRRFFRGDLLAGDMETFTVKDIERAIRRVIEQNSDVRNMVKEMAKCRVALQDGFVEVYTRRGRKCCGLIGWNHVESKLKGISLYIKREVTLVISQ
ncbi:unnamed protein product [Eruca vesicaria subsp. sativa]|uniref:Uncharacterized protein n=1 Tax=Eruca vesicaria subsp. sativa TaxID=29727 RepID=A0ABC8JW22_ERUVS|nr:unnamed protein product [Eruca vesicaria subsp. sativa]